MSNLYRNIDSGQLKGIGELLVLEEKAIKYWNNLIDNFRGEKKILLRDENTVSIEVHWDISSVKKKTLHSVKMICYPRNESEIKAKTINN